MLDQLSNNVILRMGNNSYEGFINVRNSSFYFTVSLPNFPSFKEFKLNCDWKLKLILKSQETKNLLQVQGEKCDSINSFTEILASIIFATIEPINHNPISLKSYKFYERVNSDLIKIGPSATIRPDFSAVTFEISDNEGRHHSAVVRLPSEYPSSSVIVESHDLPLTKETIFTCGADQSQIFGLTDFACKFSQLITLFQPFWKVMEILDSNCWVLEPQSARLSDNFRRVQISDYCSALLTLNPFNIRTRPTIEFRGRQDEVERFTNMLEGKLLDDLWEDDVDIHLNLLSLLELDFFPSKENEIQEEGLIQPGDCSICFEDRLDGQPASIRCDNSLCNSQYHQVCLFRYLCGDLKNVRMQNAVLGRCPTCRDTIGCSTVSWDQM